MWCEKILIIYNDCVVSTELRPPGLRRWLLAAAPDPASYRGPGFIRSYDPRRYVNLVINISSSIFYYFCSDQDIIGQRGRGIVLKPFNAASAHYRVDKRCMHKDIDHNYQHLFTFSQVWLFSYPSVRARWINVIDMYKEGFNNMPAGLRVLQICRIAAAVNFLRWY